METINHEIYEAKYMISAISPTLGMKIHFNPTLPMTRNQLIIHMPWSSIIKYIFYYKDPFWRKKDYCGTMTVDGEEPPIAYTLDNTKPDGSYPCPQSQKAGMTYQRRKDEETL